MSLPFFLRRVSKRILPVCGLVVALGAGGCDGGAKQDSPVDRDEDGWPSDLDCNDNIATVFPSADEIPGDGIDQDCSGSDAIDEGGAGAPGTGGKNGTGGAGGSCSDCGTGGTAAIVDVDRDGFEAAPNGGDCDDLDSAVNPKRVEIPLDGIDQNCDGEDVPKATILPFLPEEAVAAEAPVLATGESDGKPVILAVWADSRVAPRQDLYGQLLDAEGAPLGDVIEIDTEDNFAKYDVAIASKGDGFLVTWSTNEGTKARLLDADGSLLLVEGTMIPLAILGLGDPGAYSPKPAFGGMNWCVAWIRGADEEVSVRAISPTGVRAEIENVPSASVGSLDLVGRDGGFLLAWEGRLASDVASENPDPDLGISAQLRGLTCAPSAPAFDVLPDAHAPTLAKTPDGYALVHSVAGPLGVVATESLDKTGMKVGKARTLSLESPLHARIRAVSLSSGFEWTQSSETDGSGESLGTVRAPSVFVAYQDSRFESSPFNLGSIYANAFDDDATLFSRGIAVALNGVLELGDLAALSDHIFLAVRTSGAVGLVRIGRE